MFKKSLFLLPVLLVFASFPAFAQKPRPAGKIAAKTNPTKPAAKAGSEKEAFEKALAQTDAATKITALQEFTENFPSSENKIRALEVIVSSRAQLADEKLRAGEVQTAVTLFKQAVTDAPAPLSDKLFTDVILQLPTNLFYGGQQLAAIEVAKLIEEKVKDNPKRLLGLATFYLGTENAAEAIKLADAAIAIDANLSAAYQTLGLANRLNFQLEDSAAAYAKALEIDPNSAVSKRSLAEMRRALGKSDEAVALYRQLLEKDANDGAANNGLILSLFDVDKKTEAEQLLNKSLEANPTNLPLLVGAAYWYAAHDQGEKAVDFAQKALAIEPRYTWAHIALARGLVAQNRPLEAEKPLLVARQYGNFPTLNYELASVRMSAGFYQEAANELKKNFVIKDGLIETKLANRVPKQAANFIELIELERRASIFEPVAADTTENAEKVKALLTLNQSLSSAETTEGQLNQAVDEFTKGGDKMKTHRQLYAAERLLQEKKNLSKSLELTQNAVRGVDESLTVNNPAAAVLAEELIDSRTIAISRGELIVVPEVPRQMLSQILRGRIEDTAGWTLYQQQKPQEAAIRLKRAVSILPEKSSFWRSSMWRLGAALDADGKTKEALDAYVKSYTDGPPDLIRRNVIEAAYRKVNGNLDGLDDKIGARPAGETVAQVTATPSPEIAPTPAIAAVPISESTSSPTPAPETNTLTTPTPEVKPEISPTPVATPEATPEKTPEPTPTPLETTAATPVTTPTPEIIPTPTATPAIDPKPEKLSPSETETAQKIALIPKETQSATRNPRIRLIPKPQVFVSENNSPANETTSQPTEKSSSAESTKSSFESVIINVPKVETTKPKSSEETPTQSSTPTENPSKPDTETVASPSRPRVILTDRLSDKSSETPSCLVASQETISVLSQGGNLGVLIGYTQDEDISKITAESGSPGDVTVTREAEIGKQSNRAFFVIKSISAKTGEIPVTFISPCGKKEIRVIVR